MRFSLPVFAMRQHQIILSANSFCRTGLLIKNRSLFDKSSSLLYFKNQLFYSKPFSALPNLIGKNKNAVPRPYYVSASMPSSRVLISSQFSSEATSGQKKGSSKFKVLLLGFGLGGLAGLWYAYKKINQKVLPIANVGSGNNMLYSEAPPVKLVTKKVFCFINTFWSTFQFFSLIFTGCES